MRRGLSVFNKSLFFRPNFAINHIKNMYTERLKYEVEV